MKKIIFIIVTLVFISCQNKEVLLPELDKTVVKDVNNHSLIYFFFKIEKNDTIIEVNRNNTISSTNWIFNIDKRLPLKLVIPEVIKLQDKKESSLHKDSTSQNYFSYSNKVKWQLAFLNFTNTKFKFEKPKYGTKIYFKKNNSILVDTTKVSQAKLFNFIENLPSDKPIKFVFCFDKNLLFNEYLSYKIFLESKKINADAVDWVY